MKLTEKKIRRFVAHLIREDKSENTIKKYARDTRAFLKYAQEREISKSICKEYKEKLINDGYSRCSINSMLASLNSLFTFLGKEDLKLRELKLQRKVYCPEQKELTKNEYISLVKTAERQGNERLGLLIQTICTTGIRVSEVKYITKESVQKNEADVTLKGKSRSVLIIKELCDKLLRYAKKKNISSGPIFVTRSGKPMDRTNIWREMKKLCKEAGVDPQKVYPHNLRHLFARIFYSMEKDIAKLADILGHSSINTTRIYIISTGAEHRRCLEKMRLLI